MQTTTHLSKMTLQAAVATAKTRFRLAEEKTAVVSCYEVGRDGFWLHRLGGHFVNLLAMLSMAVAGIFLLARLVILTAGLDRISPWRVLPQPFSRPRA